MMRARITSLAGALTLAALLTLTWLPGVATASEPVYPVMNTSEYPPDGIYFRNSPDWNNTSRITGFGVFAGVRSGSNAGRTEQTCHGSTANEGRRSHSTTTSPDLHLRPAGTPAG